MKTVEKTLDILEVFLHGAEEISISELAKITGQNLSTIHSILREFVKRGYIRQRVKRGKYSLGLKFLSFSDAVNRIVTLLDIVRPLMVELCKEVDETVNLAINNRDYTINIDIIHSAHRLRVVSDEKTEIPLHCTGVGKIFLAGRTDKEVNDYLDIEQLVPYTPNTIVDQKKLRSQIRRIRREGVAWDIEEYEIGISNVAAPIRDYNGRIAAVIGILGPSIRVTRKKIRDMTPVVKAYASEMSKAVGYQKGKSK
ncbi:IclR family transcriptional regulator [Chloroflexota bacterium]